VHEIAAWAALREFKGHRRNAHLRDSAAIRRDSLRFDFWRWTLASIGIAHQRAQRRTSTAPPVGGYQKDQAGNGNPSTRCCDSHSSGSCVRSLSKDSAVSSGGWQPLTICSTISGARKARRIMRLT